MKLPKLDLRYIYVLFSFSLPWCCKIGISKDVNQRKAQIQRELSAAMGYNIIIRRATFDLPSLFAESSEAKLHWFFRRLSRKNMPCHAGKSEWMWYLNILTGLLFYFVGGEIGLNVVPAHIALIAIIPIPFDFALLVLAFAFIVYCLVFIAGAIGFWVVRYLIF